MKVSELIRLIKKKGGKFQEHGTNHDWYYNPKTGQRTQVPRHEAKEIGTGLVNKILKDLGLNK